MQGQARISLPFGLQVVGDIGLLLALWSLFLMVAGIGGYELGSNSSSASTCGAGVVGLGSMGIGAFAAMPIALIVALLIILPASYVIAGSFEAVAPGLGTIGCGVMLMLVSAILLYAFREHKTKYEQSALRREADDARDAHVNYDSAELESTNSLKMAIPNTDDLLSGSWARGGGDELRFNGDGSCSVALECGGELVSYSAWGVEDDGTLVLGRGCGDSGRCAFRRIRSAADARELWAGDLAAGKGLTDCYFLSGDTLLLGGVTYARASVPAA